MPTTSNINPLNLTTSSRIARVIQPLEAPFPPCPDVHMPSYKPSTPLRVLNSASFRSYNPPSYVKDAIEPTINLDDIETCTLSSDESSTRHGKILILRSIMTTLKNMVRKFRSLNLPIFASSRL